MDAKYWANPKTVAKVMVNVQNKVKLPIIKIQQTKIKRLGKKSRRGQSQDHGKKKNRAHNLRNCRQWSPDALYNSYETLIKFTVRFLLILWIKSLKTLIYWAPWGVIKVNRRVRQSSTKAEAPNITHFFEKLLCHYIADLKFFLQYLKGKVHTWVSEADTLNVKKGS